MVRQRMIDKVTVEGIVGVGLVAALLLSILMGEEKLANDIAMGLIGYVGRHVVTLGADKK